MSASEVVVREACIEEEAEERQSYTRRVRRRLDKLTREKNDALREVETWRLRAEKAEADLMHALLVIGKYQQALRERKANAR